MRQTTSASDLWKQLSSDAGLELRLKGGGPGRDSDVEESLRTALAVPPHATSLATWLAADAALSRPTVSVEQLLVAILTSQQGFAEMMRDILDLLIAAQARRASQSLSIQFRFDDVCDPIRATLEEFREVVERIERVVASRYVLPSSSQLWDLWRVVDEIGARRPNVYPAGFPTTPPAPETGHHELDDQLKLITELVVEFRSRCLQFGETRQEVVAAARELTPEGSRSQMTTIRDQLNASSDYWDVTILYAAESAAEKVLAGSIDANGAAARLAPLLEGIEREDQWITRTAKQLLDILNLPTWRRRHELYSVWVGTRLIRTAEAYADDIRFHPVEGVLSFEFGGSRLATFDWQEAQFDIWAELRSALVGSSAKRKKGIQPDFRVVKAGIGRSTNANTTFVLECKHYLSPKASNFAQAAADYSRSCPNASVLLVNHGPADDRLLHASVAAELRYRISFLGNATAQEERRGQFIGDAIREALFPGSRLRPPAPDILDAQTSGNGALHTPGTVASVRLIWDSSLADMDLALEILGPDGDATESVDFRHLGDLTEPPFARLESDVKAGPGEERLDISAWHYSRYTLVATNFSKTGQMTPNNLRCEIRIDQRTTILQCPVPGRGHVWNIAELTIQGGIVNVTPLDR